MWRWFKSRDLSDRLLIIFGGLIALLFVLDNFDSPSPLDASADQSLSTVPRSSDSTTDRPGGDYASAPTPPAAVVNGSTYSGREQIEAMTQAARDAGMDEATARRTGEEAAVLCNGNPDCLR